MTLAQSGAGGVTAEDLLHAPPIWRASAIPAIGGPRIVAEGELDLAVIARLEELAQTLAVVPGQVVRVDLTSVGFIDSSIVAFLLRLNERTTGVSARLEVAVQPRSGVHRTLTVCGACEILNLV
jgi:anti-anti-sigma factor